MGSREKILEAVVKTFLTEGIEGITMKKVALEAGIGKSTVYEYFESKESLIAEAVIFSANKFIDEYYNKEWNHPDFPFEQAMKSSIAYLIQAFKSELGKFITLVQESNAIGKSNSGNSNNCGFQKEMATLHVKSIDYTREIVNKGQKEGVLRNDLLELDVVNFQRIFLLLSASFSEKVPMIAIMANEVEDQVSYVYDALIRLYGQ